MPNDDKWAQYVEKSSADKWEQYAQPIEATPPTSSLYEQGQKSFAAQGGNVGMPGSFEGHPENVGEYVPQTIGNVASGVGNIAQGNVARGAHEILSGGMNTLLPAAPFVATAAPGAFALGTAGSYVGGKVGRGAATIFGRSPDQQDLAEDVGSIVGGAAPFARIPAGKLLTTAAGEPRMGLKLLAPKRAEVLAEYLRPDVKAQAKAAAEQADILAERQKRAAAWDEMNKDFAKRQAALDKEKAKAVADAARKGGMTKPPTAAKRVIMPASEMFGSSATTSVEPGAGVPQGSPTPFQPINQGRMTKTAPYTEVPGITPPPAPTPAPSTIMSPEATTSPQGKQPTSLLSRAKTPIELGVEPDMNNPAHVKMINDIIGQGLNEAAIKKLKVRADFGDRFAAVALDYWRSKTGR